MLRAKLDMTVAALEETEAEVERLRAALERQRRECPDAFCFCENIAYEALSQQEVR